MKNEITRVRRAVDPLPPSTFLLFFGNTAFNRLLDFLIEHEEFDYSLTEIARNAEVSWSMTNLLWPRLLKHGIAVETRRVGRARMYRLNAKSPLVQRLLKLDWELSKQAVLQEAREQALTVNVQKGGKR